MQLLVYLCFCSGKMVEIIRVINWNNVDAIIGLFYY